MYTISKEFHAECAHSLSTVPPGHKCSNQFEDGSPRVHGHSYIFVFELAAEELDDQGFVIDYGDLSPIKNWIDLVIDHHNLNDIFTMPTTAENIAKWMYDQWIDAFPQLVAVRVSETMKTWAEYRP